MAYSNINKPTDYFETQLHTGNNGSGRTFTGLDFTPEFIWGKVRDSSNYYHFVVDIVRGGDKFLAPNVTAAEDNKSHGEITSFNSDGTTWIDGTNATYPRVYYNDGAGSTLGGSTYVNWNWKAGGTGVSNTDGSITSTVSANTTSGFSIVSYTGNITAGATVGHGLGDVPKFIIVKNRAAAAWDWTCYHASLGNTRRIFLNSTSAGDTTSAGWNNTTPSSLVVTLGAGRETNNDNTLIMYCFAEKKGFSKFGSYTGNGNTDGTFVYTGFKPAFFMAKRTDTSANWAIIDNQRNTFNVETKRLFPNLVNAEESFDTADFVSNGLKFKTTSGDWNVSGGTYIYMAFAESPLVAGNYVPTTAR